MHLAKFFSGILLKQLLPVLVNDGLSADIAGVYRPLKLVTDISTLPVKTKQDLERRMKYIKAIRKRCISRGQRQRVEECIPVIAEKIKDSNPPSTSTVLGWMRLYELSSMNPASLISGNQCRRRNRRTHFLIEELTEQKLRSLFLTPARHTLQHVLEQIKIEAKKLHQSGKLTQQEATVSLSTVSRRLAEFSPYDIDRARYGLQYARAKFRTTVEGVQATRVLQRLECDHTPLNWVIVCDRTGLPLGRPTLTIIVDSLTGYVVGIYVSFNGPGLTSVLNVLKNAILPKDDLAAAAGATNPWLAFGVGETLMLDNGLEFHSPQFQLAGWELGIDIEYCRVRTPWLKPKVERFFANLDHFSLIRGRVRKPMDNVLNIDPREDAAITFTDFVKGLIRFVVDVYPFQLNSRRLMTPFECFKESMALLPPPVFPTSFEQLDMIAAMSKTLTVGPGGVELLGLTYSSPELLGLKRNVGSRFKTLIKWNPDDMSFIYLQDPKSTQWLPVPSIRQDYTSGLSWLQHRLLRKHAREKHVAGGGYEQLIRSKQELHELWMNGLSKRNRSRDIKTLARFSGLSSDQIVLGTTEENAPRLASKVVSSQEIDLANVEVPEFDSFSM